MSRGTALTLGAAWLVASLLIVWPPVGWGLVLAAIAVASLAGDVRG